MMNIKLCLHSDCSDKTDIVILHSRSTTVLMITQVYLILQNIATAVVMILNILKFLDIEILVFVCYVYIKLHSVH